MVLFPDLNLDLNLDLNPGYSDHLACGKDGVEVAVFGRGRRVLIAKRASRCAWNEGWALPNPQDQLRLLEGRVFNVAGTSLRFGGTDAID